MEKKIGKQNKITDYFKEKEKNNTDNNKGNTTNIKSDDYNNNIYEYIYDENSNSTKFDK